MRVAILLAKAQQARVKFDEQVAFFVAKHIRSNVRELEGALKRIVAYANFHGQEISLAVAKEALRDLLAVQNRQISIRHPEDGRDYYESVLELQQAVRAIARRASRDGARRLTQLSLPEIGNNFGVTTRRCCTRAPARKLRESRGPQHDVNFLLQCCGLGGRKPVVRRRDWKWRQIRYNLWISRVFALRAGVPNHPQTTPRLSVPGYRRQRPVRARNVSLSPGFPPLLLASIYF
jgi:hypothetical protein